MNDKELLELAARAIGGSNLEVYDIGDRHGVSGHFPESPNSLTYWNPLTDDGDALRLAVAVGINVHVDQLDEECNPVTVAKAFGLTACIERHHSDPCAATRRAIVRAAAKIGRNM